MKSLSVNLIEEKNALHSKNPWVVLIDITLTDAGPTIIRVCNIKEGVTYGGNEYQKFNFQLGIVESDVSGQIPQVSLKVCNISRLLTNYLNSLDGGMGSTVRITVVNYAYLAEDYSELQMDFTVMGCQADANWVTWTLGMANPRNQRFPLYRYLANHCAWASNFKGAECGYSGAETECDGTFDTCINLGNTGRYCGFLGMQSDGIRIA